MVGTLIGNIGTMTTATGGAMTIVMDVTIMTATMGVTTTMGVMRVLVTIMMPGAVTMVQVGSTVTPTARRMVQVGSTVIPTVRRIVQVGSTVRHQ